MIANLGVQFYKSFFSLFDFCFQISVTLDEWNINTQGKLRKIMEHNLSIIIVMSLIILNAVFMGLEHYNQPQALTNFLEIMNLIFTFIFLAEVLIKLYAYGFHNFVREAFNVIDAAVIAVKYVKKPVFF